MADVQKQNRVLEFYFDWKWWKSSVTGKRCIYAPDRQPEWFQELADGTEPLVWDFENIKRPNFLLDADYAINLLEIIREKLDTKVVISDYYKENYWQVKAVDRDLLGEGVTLPEAIFDLALKGLPDDKKT